MEDTFRRQFLGRQSAEKEKNRAHWQAEADELFIKWGFHDSPPEVKILLDQLEATWKQSATKQCLQHITRCKDPLTRAPGIARSFGIAFTEDFKALIAAEIPAFHNQTMITNFFESHKDNDSSNESKLHASPSTPLQRDLPAPSTPQKNTASIVKERNA